MIARVVPALRRWQTWGWILVGTTAAYVVYLLVSGLLTPAAPIMAGDNQMIMRNIVAEGSHGTSGWKFVADSSEISPDGYTTTYHGVRDAAFYRDGKPAYRLQADSVVVDSRNQNYAATGGVHVWSTAKTLPDDLRTDNAYWDQASQTLSCSSATRFVYHGTTLNTTHMTVNMQTGAAQLGDTSVDFAATPGPPTPSISAAPIPILQGSAGPVAATPSPARP